MTLHETEAALLGHLTTITDHWDAMLIPRSSGSIARGSGGSATLADDHADTDADTDRLHRLVSLRRQTVDTLNSWSRVVMEDRPVTEALPDGASAPSMCAFLTVHAQWFAGHEAVEVAIDELRPLAARIHQLVNPARKDWVSLGACPLDVDSEEGPVKCGGQVRARTGGEGETEAQCRKCGTQAVTSWWERVLMPEASRLITAAEVPDFIRSQFGKAIKAPTVRKWIERQWIESAGSDEKGRALYDKGAVAYAIARREAG